MARIAGQIYIQNKTDFESISSNFIDTYIGNKDYSKHPQGHLIYKNKSSQVITMEDVTKDYNLVLISIKDNPEKMVSMMAESGIIGTNLTYSSENNSKTPPTINKIIQSFGNNPETFYYRNYINVLLPFDTFDFAKKVSRKDIGLTDKIILDLADIVYKVEKRENGSIYFQLTEQFDTEKFDQHYYDTFEKVHERLQKMWKR